LQRHNCNIYLVDSGAHKEVKNNKDWTPLHFAADNNKLEIVQYLVQNGADKDAKDWQDKTPLQLAQNQGHTSIVNFLSLIQANQHQNPMQKVLPQVQQHDNVKSTEVSGGFQQQGIGGISFCFLFSF
jgi:ankyrin repeat protein